MNFATRQYRSISISFNSPFQLVFFCSPLFNSCSFCIRPHFKARNLLSYEVVRANECSATQIQREGEGESSLTNNWHPQYFTSFIISHLIELNVIQFKHAKLNTNFLVFGLKLLSNWVFVCAVRSRHLPIIICVLYVYQLHWIKAAQSVPWCT